MTSKRFFFVMIVSVALLLVGFGGGAYKANGILKSESDKLLDLKLSGAVLDKQRETLNQAKRDIAEFAELETITKSILPEEKDQADTIGEIAAHAKTSGIILGAIEFPQSELGAVKGKSKAKTPAATDSNRTQLLELSDLKGVYVMEINVRNHAEIPTSYEQIIQFLELLESNRRTAQVIDIGIQQDQKIPTMFHFTIKLNTYIRPE